MQWVAKKAAMKTTVETLQEWQNTLSEDLSGKVGQWKKFKKLDKVYKKKLTTRAKDRKLPRVGGQLLLRCPPTENFPQWAIMQ